jgi:serine/threonine-protein kinase
MVQGSAARPMQMCPKCSQNNTLTARSCIHCGSPLPSIPLLAKNTVLNNRYTVLQVLGFGGFSAVYLAFDQRLSNRKVTVKELLQTNPAIVQQFETEAKLLATLSHPALPKAFDWFKQFGTDRYYLVMEFIDGVSAWEVVNRNGPMTPLSALRVMEPVFDAVAYLHRQNPPILHRDIKPQNILVSRERKVYLVDFGIAKVGGAGQKTATGARGVTPGFSPPEQYLATGETDVRSDIYSLGATMYFLLTGKVPPDATERLQREMAGQPSLEPIRSVNAAVSQQVEQAIMIAMALRKEQRFNNVGEFLAGLKGQTMLIQPPAPMPAPQPPMQPAQPPAPAQPSPAQMTPPPVVGGAREWCPACRSNFYVADPSQEWVNCPNCGQLIHRQVSDRGQKGQKMITGKKNPVVAGLLSFLIIGLGQIYNGQVAKGLFLLGLQVVGVFLGLVSGVLTCGISLLVFVPFALFIEIVSIVDAVMIANKLQQGQAVGEWEWF